MYFPFTGEPYQPKMGLKPLDWKDWLEFGPDYEFQLAKKRECFAKHRSQVLTLAPGTDSLCMELWEHLAVHLSEYYSQNYSYDPFTKILKKGEGKFLPPSSGEEAMEAISRITQEDWCILQKDSQGVFRLVVGSVCFPSRWNLLEKAGKDADAIHEPVPDYAKMLASPTKNFLDKLPVDKPMWRLNWTIHDSAELFCPGPVAANPNLTPEDILSHCVLRVERQTLSRLPRSGAIAFSIRTHITPLAGLAADPEKRKLMHLSLLGLPLETAQYRGMGPFFESLKKALSLGADSR